MKNLFEAARAKEVKERMALLRPDSERLWGTMNAPQAVAHCSAGLELALGNKTPPRVLVVRDERYLRTERERLSALIDRFAATGPAGCTKHPHSFFGRLTPDQWAILMYKHLDHHLRQFGV